MKKQIQIKFEMNAEDYTIWREGAIGEEFEDAHPITKKSFNAIVAVSGKFSTFQHIKSTKREVEITFYEDNLLNLVYFAADIMDQI